MKINKYFILETINTIFVTLIVFYPENPTKAQKKKVTEYLKSMPHLMFDDHTQNRLFELINNHPIESYFDCKSDMSDYLYYIYRELAYSLGLKPKEYSQFYSGIEKEMTNDNRILRN